MENASKALMMAGGVLIGIMLASFMVMMLRRGGQLSAEYDTQIADNELVKFNSKFEVYAKENNTFFDVMTVLNLAWDINKRYDYDVNNGMSVVIKEGSNVIYRLEPDENLSKRNLFVGKTDNTKNIYDIDASSGKSIIEDYTQTKSKDDNSPMYLFDASSADSIVYSELTGKVKKMTFVKKNNNSQP